MRTYSTFTCREMIRHYQTLSTNTERTENVRQLALQSLTDWTIQLQRAEAALLAE